MLFRSNDTATTEIYTLSLHDALPIYQRMISRLEFSDISSAIAMEEMKYTTAIPTNYIAIK